MVGFARNPKRILGTMGSGFDTSQGNDRVARNDLSLDHLEKGIVMIGYIEFNFVLV